VTRWEDAQAGLRAESGKRFLMQNKRVVTVLWVGADQLRYQDAAGHEHRMPIDAFERQILSKHGD